MRDLLYDRFAAFVNPALLLQAAGMTPDPWQRSLLLRRPQRSLLNCTRQGGKSQTVAAMAAGDIMGGDALVLIACPAERQAKLMIKAISKLMKAAGNPPRQPESSTHLEWADGSECWALPSKEANIRGFAAVTLLILDEAARVPDDTYNACRPMLSVSNGRLVCMSTPFGKRGFFHKEWTEGGADWYRVLVTAPQCPRISQSFLAEEKRALPDSWYRQEYFCEFAETNGAVFSYDDLMASITDEVRPLFDTRPTSIDSEVEPLFQ